MLKNYIERIGDNKYMIMNDIELKTPGLRRISQIV